MSAQYVSNPENTVEIQEEATVSRTVLKADDVNVVIFSFDAGQELSEHTAAMPVVLQALSGEIEVTTGSETNILTGNDVLYLPVREPHAVKALTPAKLMLTMVTGLRAE